VNTEYGMAWSKHGDYGRCVDAFDRCARLYPGSPLADDAQRAASYWRPSVAKR